MHGESCNEQYWKEGIIYAANCTRCYEEQNDLEQEQRRQIEVQKSLRKLERKTKETLYANEEDKKNVNRIQDLCDKLQLKVRSNMDPPDTLMEPW